MKQLLKKNYDTYNLKQQLEGFYIFTLNFNEPGFSCKEYGFHLHNSCGWKCNITCNVFSNHMPGYPCLSLLRTL